MTRFDADTIARWTKQMDDWLAGNFGITDRYGITERAHVTRGADAWTLAHKVGITREAYQDRDVVDAHIVTALKRVFPNAVFQDRYTY